MTRLQDVARWELGAQDYSRRSYLEGNPAVALPIYKHGPAHQKSAEQEEQIDSQIARMEAGHLHMKKDHEGDSQSP